MSENGEQYLDIEAMRKDRPAKRLSKEEREKLIKSSKQKQKQRVEALKEYQQKLTEKYEARAEANKAKDEL